MRVIIAGSRDITNYRIVSDIIDNSGFNISVILSGNARGVDRLGIRYARDNGIPIEIFEPDWEKFGKKAGIIRNCEMGDKAEGLIAIWDGTSRGTKHMIQYAMDVKCIKKIHIVKNIEFGESEDVKVHNGLTTWC